MNVRTLRLGTRGSALALWQANWTKDQLEQRWPELAVALVPIKTTGDKILDVPLAKIGGKGLFTKEIDEALLDDRIDLAVHSMKDVPFQLPNGIVFGAIPEREDPRDAFISNGPTLERLRPGSTVGTSSLRRQVQLRHRFPALKLVGLRGNVDTRLRRAAAGGFQRHDAAAASRRANRRGRQSRRSAGGSRATPVAARHRRATTGSGGRGGSMARFGYAGHHGRRYRHRAHRARVRQYLRSLRGRI